MIKGKEKQRKIDKDGKRRNQKGSSYFMNYNFVQVSIA